MTAPSDQPLATRLAQALGDAYTIEGEVGRGGMGVVYRARDERLQRRVAIKVLPPELAFQSDIRERFTREAQTAAKLSHPHIVPIHTVGEGHGLVYFVMGYVDGESVASRIRRRGKLPVEETRRIMAESADALGAAHALSIIHRDIKPDNILLSQGHALVADFGIARALAKGGEERPLTRSLDCHPGARSISRSFVIVPRFRAVTPDLSALSTAKPSWPAAIPFTHQRYAAREPTAITSGFHACVASASALPRALSSANTAISIRDGLSQSPVRGFSSRIAASSAAVSTVTFDDTPSSSSTAC